MITCQSIFVPGLPVCTTPLAVGTNPVRVLSPVISTAYLCDDCKTRHTQGE